MAKISSGIASIDQVQAIVGFFLQSVVLGCLARDMLGQGLTMSSVKDSFASRDDGSGWLLQDGRGSQAHAAEALSSSIDAFGV
jgi:hypothetical protein